MEDSKRIYKFYGRPAVDIFLWSGRTEAALAAKEVLPIIESDVLAGEEAPGEEVLKQISTARAVMIQGLGYRPLRLCFYVKDNPYMIWNRLKDKCAVSNIATTVQIRT